MAQSKLYGACRRVVDGGVDGCGEFAASEDRPSFYEACDHHKSFHRVLDVEAVTEPQNVPILTGSSLGGEGPSFQSQNAAGASAEKEVRRSPRVTSAKRVLNVSDMSPAFSSTSNGGLSLKKVKVESNTNARPEVNPYAPALADLQKEFHQEGSGRFEFRKEGGAWQIWCCLCKNLNKVGPGPRKLGNFKKHFTSKKHQEMLKTEEEDASAKEVAAVAKAEAKRQREDLWLSTWSSEGRFASACNFLWLFASLTRTNTAIGRGDISSWRGS
jgi:hypothetical protein